MEQIQEILDNLKLNASEDKLKDSVKYMKEKFEAFVSKVKEPKLKGSAEYKHFLKMLDSIDVNEDNEAICIDECDKAQMAFEDFWEARSELDARKFLLKYGKPFTINKVDYVDAVKNSKSEEEIQNLLQTCKMFADKNKAMIKRLSIEVDNLIRDNQQLTDFLSKIESFKRSDCSPCATTDSFKQMQNNEFEDLNAMKTILNVRS